MSKDKHTQAILEYLSRKEAYRLRPRKLARKLGISEKEYGEFRAAYKKLRDSGRLVLGSNSALTLPTGAAVMEGRFQANARGFGFIVPEDPDSRGDLFVPPDKTGGAMTGDLVVARVIKQGKRHGKMRLAGDIIEIRERGLKNVIGCLMQTDGAWFVMPDGRAFTTPIIVSDMPVEMRREGLKVVAELVKYPENGELPTGVVTEVLGPSGRPETEIRAVMKAYGLPEKFPEEAMSQARQAARDFKPEDTRGREDLSNLTIATIDPVSARDFDDAVSIEKHTDGTTTLGVHIADVAHFVTEGSPLDLETKCRGTSVYFPRKVVPMLPEILSNGLCSLQEGEPRFTKSVFITYDKCGEVIGDRAAETITKSRKRLTYEEAQAICDGKTSGFPPDVVKLVEEMEQLARIIEERRKRAGMLHLDLPEMELILDSEGRVIDAAPADEAYTHTIIEMFMVEANDAVARVFAESKIPIIRRIHPEPDEEAYEQLVEFTHACGRDLSSPPSRLDIQSLVESIAGSPESHAINMAILRSFKKASYSIDPVGHFALASSDYCHFTSPIRRYPDLTVHRALSRLLNKEIPLPNAENTESAHKLARDLSAKERSAEAAEHELRQVLVLQYLKDKRGDVFEGVVTGVTDFGLFVQLPKYLVDGLIRLQDLGDDWWQVSASKGTVTGEMSGERYRLGDAIDVRIAQVDVARRELDLVLVSDNEKSAKKNKPARRARRRKPRRIT
ncbi:MAG: ribonuclease R [Proteobacteria bacterium]|nr:ribonuclease R [Pseudomonadota bacterium]